MHPGRPLHISSASTGSSCDSSPKIPFAEVAGVADRDGVCVAPVLDAALASVHHGEHHLTHRGMEGSGRATNEKGRSGGNSARSTLPHVDSVHGVYFTLKKAYIELPYCRTLTAQTGMLLCLLCLVTQESHGTETSSCHYPSLRRCDANYELYGLVQ
jgi:hypothetical protein